MKTTQTLIKEIEVRSNLKFDWNKASHRFRLTSKIDRELEKLFEIERILNRK